MLEKTNAKYSQSTDADGNCELIVYFPHPSDSGRYTCHASNRAGENSIGQYVVFEGVAEVAETKLVRVFHHEAHRIEQARIDARGGAPKKRDEWVPPPTPPPEDEAPKKSRYQRPQLPPSDEPAKSFLPVVYPPIVIETTFAETSSESEEEEPLYVRRNRHPPHPREMLRFTAPLTKQTVATGGRAKFTCYLEGPQQHSRWVKLFVEKPKPDDGEEVYISKYFPPVIDDGPKEPVFLDLEDGDKYAITMRDGLLTLCVNDVDEDDAGEYTVVCHNKVCEIRSTGTLVVYSRLDALKTPAFFVWAMRGMVGGLLRLIIFVFVFVWFCLSQRLCLCVPMSRFVSSILHIFCSINFT